MESPQIRYHVFGRREVFDRTQIRDLIRAGEVTSFTDVAVEGTERWKPASNYPELQHYLSLAALERQEHESIAAPSRGGTSLKALIIGALVTIIGFFVMLSSASDVLHGLQSKRWPSSPATIIDSELVSHTSYGRRRRSTSYELRVVYQYHDGDKGYTSNAIAFGKEWTISPSRQLDRIRSENPLLAYYDPAVPTTAVLHPGVTWSAMFWTLSGLVAFVAGLLLAMNPRFMQTIGDRISQLSTIRLGRS